LQNHYKTIAKSLQNQTGARRGQTGPDGAADGRIIYF
jgi:hypothetical protein